MIQRRLNSDQFNDAALNIAEIYRDEENYTMMYPYLKEAQKSYKSDVLRYDDPKAYLDILWGDYYRGLAFNNKALSYYQSAYDIIERFEMSYLALNFYNKYCFFLSFQIKELMYKSQNL